MKKLILILFVPYVSLVFASKLAPLEINTLETESVFIIIGKVEKTTLLEGNKDGAKNYKIDVNIISYLKGENNTKFYPFHFGMEA